MLNLTGQPGRDALQGFRGVNFDVSVAADVPQPASLALWPLKRSEYPARCSG
jgi:hypothetical protein